MWKIQPENYYQNMIDDEERTPVIKALKIDLSIFITQPGDGIFIIGPTLFNLHPEF